MNMPSDKGHEDVHAAICALTDPFCDHADGVRFPDSAGIKSLPFRLHSRFNVQANATGGASLLFCPGYDYQYAAAVLSGGDVIATYTNFSTSLNGTSMAPVTFRVVNWGIIARNTSSQFTTQGMWRVRGYANPVGTNLAVTSTFTYNVDWAEDLPVSSTPTLHVVGKRYNAATSTNYSNVATINPAATVASWISPGWQAVQIALTGGANAQTFDIEFFMNYELAFEDADALAILSKPSIPDNFPLRQAASHVEHARPPATGHRHEFDKVMKELASKAAKKVGQEAIKQGMKALERPPPV